MLQRPHTELVGLADALQNAAEFYRQRTSDIKIASPLSPPYIALMMGWGAARNVDAVSILAKTDQLLVPAAWSNARAACEIALRARASTRARDYDGARSSPSRHVRNVILGR
jgi:hypothetical protein